MFFNSEDAQGTIEYLVIVAIIIVIGLVVANLTMNLFDTQKITSRNLGEISGLSGITIIDAVNDYTGTGILALKNTSGETLTIKKISTSEGENWYDKQWISGNEELIQIEGLCNCEQGQLEKNVELTIHLTTKYGIEKIIIITTTINCQEEYIVNPTKPIVLPEDSTQPTFSNYLDNSNTLQGHGEGTFNIIVNDTNGTVLLEVNDQNILALLLSDNNYEATHEFNLSGNYNYKWHSWGNGSRENYASSETKNYIVRELVYTVSFDNQGADINAIPLNKNVVWPETTIDNLPTEPQKEDYYFSGWYTQINGGGTEFNASTIVDNNIIVYAYWQEILFAGGSGTIGDPYQIETWKHLNNIRLDLSANYVLNKDLDNIVEGYSEYGEDWNPIGNSSTAFDGNFDGNNHIITGLKINKPDSDYIGFFGKTTGTISNISFLDINVVGNQKVGGLIGYSAGPINNSFTTGDITGYSSVGGLVGQLHTETISNSGSTTTINCPGWAAGGLVGGMYSEGKIIDSYATGNINAVWASPVGGLVGTQSGGIISRSYATGNVNGGFQVGGLVGRSQGTISNSYARGDVNGIEHVGGLAGEIPSGSIINSFAIGNVVGHSHDYPTGGLVGNATAWISNSFSTSHVIGNSYYTAGLIGHFQAFGTTITNTYWDTTLSGQSNCYMVDSNSGCTSTTNNEAYYYNPSNSPLSSWTWGVDGNWTTQVSDYPILTWQTQ
ncbi:MAG: InlB B-repeat-containing protein [Candidatus ainarchaeum sp.]|nr:InlB B-repeat-containing protein [Candidatus ainarchaeum sp.]